MALSTISMMDASSDIASSVAPFLSDQFLNTAGLSRTWRDAYDGLPTTTRGVDKDTTVTQFMDHLQMGHGQESAPTDPGVYTPPSRIAHAQIPCMIAASLGRTDLLQVAYGSGIARKDVTACTSAAANGHLQTIKYLRFIECPWDESTAIAAVEGGHFELLRWIIDHGCPSNELIQLEAAYNGRLDMVVWLHYNGHPVSSDVLDEAVYSGSTHIIDWAKSIGVEYSRTFTAAVDVGGLEMVKHLSATRHMWDHTSLVECVNDGHVSSDVVEWLTEHWYIG